MDVHVSSPHEVAMNTAKQAPDLSQAEAGSSAEVQPVEVLAEEFLRRYRQGEQPTLAEYLERYPELAEQIRAVFPALIAVEQLKPASSDASAAEDTVAAPLVRRERIGAYRLLRVLGRGGMGVVYEAEHESLGRRVALKVLPVDVARDAKLLARFRRESRAAAQLHHSNIVPVFEVGQEGDIFFYAMQYIPGQPVDAVIQELQRLRAASGSAPVPEASAVARSLLTGRFEPAPSLDATLDAEPETSEPLPSAAPVVNAPAALSGQSELSMVETNYRLYCRNVARLGMQVAEALAYAHGRGIVHRDIKPSNLLLDTAGLAWVSDFGLAKTQEHALTETGDLVGTLRYMAPERFQGVCDAQADVYALGLTLYELLLLRPAFDAPDRLRLIDQIGHQEPARPRTLDPRIPRDLETILMKAIEKEPRRRYQSAEALAGDLRRFLADEPIQARRIGPLERLGRWGRRNPLVAGLSAAVVLVTALGFAGVFGQMQEAKEQRDVAQQQRDEVRALNEQLRRTTYAAHMNLAKHAWDEAAVPRVLELLEQYRPKSGEPDLRGFEWFYLYRLCHAELLTFKGHTDRIRSVLYSPDGKRLASVDRGGTVKVWDAQTGRELLTRKGGGIGMAFSPDGKRLAGASPVVARGGPEGTVKVWDAQTGQELLSLKGHTAVVNSIAFSPDGKRLASSSQDKTVKVWDTQTGQELLSLKGHTTGVSSVVFSPDGKRLASGSGNPTGGQNGEVKVWDAQTGQELLTLKRGSYGHSVVFSPNGYWLASVAGGTVKIYDATPLPAKP
jgi:serine/threonine protein kinase